MLIVAGAVAQAQVTKKYRFVDGKWIEETVEPAAGEADAANGDDEWIDYNDLLADSVGAGKLEIDTTIDVRNRMLPSTMFLPMVFDTYDVKLIGDSASIEAAAAPEPTPLDWVNDRNDALLRYQQVAPALHD